MTENQIKAIFEAILDGRTGIVEASTKLGIHKQTLHEKLIEYVNSSNNIEIKKKYIEYQQQRNPDYSFINFKALFIEMIEKNESQSQIASEYDIPARTVSRELEKLKKEEEYMILYEMAKEFSYRKMQRREFSQYEKILMMSSLQNYDEGPVIVNNSIPKEEREYKRAKELLEKAENMGGFQTEIAKKLGVGVSTLRRARKKVEEYEKKEEMKKEIEKEGEDR